MSRRTKILLGAVAVLVVVAVAVVVILVGTQSSGGRIASTTSTSQAAAFSTTTTPVSVPSTTPIAEPVARLLTLVPKNVDCTPYPEEYYEPGAVAGVECSPNATGVLSVGYSLYPDVNALENYFSTHLVAGSEPCPGRGQSPEAWHRAATPQVTEGRVVCYTTATVPNVAWTVDSQLLVGYAGGGLGGSLDQVYQWWAANYQ
jgi:hypothetical protein